MSFPLGLADETGEYRCAECGMSGRGCMHLMSRSGDDMHVRCCDRCAMADTHGRRTTLQWPTTSVPPLPSHLFGKDHWATFAYVETRAVDHDGELEHDRMRCHGGRHPQLLAAKRYQNPPHSVDAKGCATVIKAAGTCGPGGRFARAELRDHDDYDCLDDLAAAGLLVAQMPEPGEGGWYVYRDGKPILPPHGWAAPIPALPGLTADQIGLLATAATWTLTPLGWRVAGQVRAFKAAGGSFHDFEPDLAVA